MKFIPDCPECQRLWKEYSDATTAHIKLESELDVAALSYNPEIVSVLTPKVEDAAMARLVARDAIRDHEAVAHPNAEVATA